ncbi:MAG: formylglycine-generating enzyme family protein, partial [bacterium]|nr:formylglycine-generating enzyme family protein [bacterium]
GTYRYSVPKWKFLFLKFKQKQTVQDFYLCKYPVTNQRYRRFIDWLEGKLKDYDALLSIDRFAEKLRQFGKSVTGFTDYLGENPGDWADKFRSRYDNEKSFNGDDQPVVGVPWYGARAYCFWLSCLESALTGDTQLKDFDRLVSLYRLPTEIQWEWAAGGEQDGSVREYPWPKEKGKPTTKLANYGRNVGRTTPVGRYPDGATPNGLMDMAGNVWEWMENYYYKDNKDYFALRGGSWFNYTTYLRCSARD